MSISLIDQAERYADKIAIIASEGTFTYKDLLDTSAQVATYILNGANDLEQQRIAFLVPSGFNYVAIQWGIWRAGGVAVPLCITHPLPELEYVISDSISTVVLAEPRFEDLLHPLLKMRQLKIILTTELFKAPAGKLPNISSNRSAMILYTSGTTNKPKGVVTTHQNIEVQVTSLISAWGWTQIDWILHFLPLHHIHGIINVLTCALWAGAKCEMLTHFDAQTIWEHITVGNLTVFMAVPTIYTKLIAAWEAAPKEQQQLMSEACSKMRLMVSGSAALPVTTLKQWQQISGHFLLERYGMTEIGMALSNPLHGQRMPGYVGTPLPNVEVRLVDDQGKVAQPGTPGEIEVRGSNVFLEYWNRPEATVKVFRDGWFRTGDVAVFQDGSYRILGRNSVDIIKTGGYKVSALEVEEVLRSHPNIAECAVVGVKDVEWGERVSAALVLKQRCSLSLEELRTWAKNQLAVYKIPSKVLTLQELPRNAMGKVTKPRLVELFMACE